ncbi:TetR/AcrR family transcriptional regulator [bacterium]|nr:TetR/AcrR family transcriptional regulator [bacterium]
MTQDKRKQRGKKTRQAILTATEEIMNLANGDSLSTRTIARKASVSQSTLYHHFSGVEEILISCLEERARESLKTDHVDNFENLYDYLEFLIQVSINSFQAIQNVALTVKEKTTRKAINDPDFRQMLFNMGLEFIAKLKTNVRTFYDSEINEERLDLTIYIFTMFRDGFVGHTQLYRENSPFGNVKEKAGSFMRILSQFIKEE